jgi:hypothetical protein
MSAISSSVTSRRCARSLELGPSSLIGSPKRTVTRCPRCGSRSSGAWTLSVPSRPTGTMGAPDVAARRAGPRFPRWRRSSGSRGVAPSKRDLSRRPEDPRGATTVEVLRLREERHRSVHHQGQEDGVHERTVVGRQDDGTIGESGVALDLDVVRLAQRTAQQRSGHPVADRTRASVHGVHLRQGDPRPSRGAPRESTERPNKLVCRASATIAELPTPRSCVVASRRPRRTDTRTRG